MRILSKFRLDRLAPFSVLATLAGILLMLTGVALQKRWVFVFGAAVFAPGALLIIVTFAVGVPVLFLEKWRGQGVRGAIRGWLSPEGCTLASAFAAAIGAVLIVAGALKHGVWLVRVGAFLAAPFVALTLLVVIVVLPILVFANCRNRRKE